MRRPRWRQLGSQAGPRASGLSLAGPEAPLAFFFFFYPASSSRPWLGQGSAPPGRGGAVGEASGPPPPPVCVGGLGKSGERQTPPQPTGGLHPGAFGDGAGAEALGVGTPARRWKLGSLGAWTTEGGRLVRLDVAGEVVARWRNWGALRMGCGQDGFVDLGD